MAYNNRDATSPDVCHGFVLVELCSYLQLVAIVRQVLHCQNLLFERALYSPLPPSPPISSSFLQFFHFEFSDEEGFLLRATL